MAPAYFLKIDGISGEILGPEHVGETRARVVRLGRVRRTAISAHQHHLHSRGEQCLAALFLACATGRRSPGHPSHL